MANAKKAARFATGLALLLAACAACAEDTITIRVGFLPVVTAPGPMNKAALAVFNAFFERHPNYAYEYATELQLPEGLSEAQQMMALAGEQGPDVFDLSIRQVQNYIRLGLVHPIDDLIAAQRAAQPDWQLPGDGVTEFHRDSARDDDGKLYALVHDYWILTLWYRRDLFEQAGIVPPRPPKDWDEYFDFAQRLTFPSKRVKTARFQAGQYGTYINSGYTAGYIFSNFVLQAGGNMTLQRRTCPDDGTLNEFPKEDRICACVKCGRSLADQPRSWILAYGREAGQKALAFYKRLRWTEWTRCPDCETPNDLPAATCPTCGDLNPIHQGVTQLECRVCGTTVAAPGDKQQFNCSKCGRDLWNTPILTGVVRVGGDGRDMFLRGEIAMMINHVEPQDIDVVITQGGLRPDQIGFGPPPVAGPGGVPAVLTGGRAWCINALTAKDPKRLKAAWDYIVFMCSDDALRISTGIYVKGGYSYLVRPQLLKRLGYSVEYEDYEPTFRRAMEDAPKYGRVQPHDLHYQHVEGNELAVPIDTVIYSGGDRKDPAKVIQASMEGANEKLYRILPPKVERQRRFWGTAAFCIAAPLVLLAFYLITRERAGVIVTARSSEIVGGRSLRARNTMIAWMLMLPALLTVLLWQYIPLLRGTTMAFFNYRLYGGGAFIGLDNFIEVLTSPDFWNSVRATFFYVSISMLIGFVAPIALALLLDEVPRGKMLFRTIFYLPAITTGLVIMFIWKMFYAPSSDGLLNRLAMPLLHFFHLVSADVQYIDWLHTPGLAMLCVIIPGVWAGAGPGSLIYLAALKTVPEDLYEAIALDGGTFVDKLRNVTYPALKPLILINFIGAFIGSFHAMSNVFVMTGGGPANSTMVLGIHIWANAFLYLRFGYATAMAWVLGSVLIGFTVLQLRILKRVEFQAGASQEAK